MFSDRPKIRTIMLKNLEPDSQVDYYPKNEKLEVICELKEVIKAFEQCEKGVIETKNSLYHYDIIKRIIEGEEEERMFVIIMTDSAYPEKSALEFINKIKAIFQSEDSKSQALLSQFRKKIYALYQECAHENDLSARFKNDSSSKEGPDIIQDLNVNSKFDYKKLLLEGEGEDEIEIKNDSKDVIGVIEDIALSNENQDMIKDGKEKMKEERDKDENKEEVNQFNQKDFIYQRMKPWKTIKIIYVVICSVLTLSVFISIFFVNQYSG